jgi:hypothetical protein
MTIRHFAGPFALTIVALAAGCGGAPPEEIETSSAELIVLPPLPKVAPDIVLQIRRSGGCLTDEEAGAARAEAEARFRAQFPGAFARVRCLELGSRTPRLQATTIGLWSGGNPIIDVAASLADHDVLTDSHAATLPAPLNLAMGTWVSRRFMNAELDKVAVDTPDFNVQGSDVYTYTNELVQTIVHGEGTGLLGIDVTVVWDERLDARSHAESPYVACKPAPSAFSVDTERRFISVAPDRGLEDGFPQTGALAELVRAGLYPSRLLVAPPDPALPLKESAVHLKYSDIRGINGGLLDGLAVVADAGFIDFLPEDRQPCALIKASFAPSLTYTAEAFDMRGPLTFEWTGVNVTPSSPSSPSTTVTLGASSPRTLTVRITDTDGVVRARSISVP